MDPRFSSTPGHPSMGRRRFVRVALASAVGMPVLMACSPEVTPFKSTDVTGATFAQDFRLKDHLGNLRTLADFKGKITVVFFGFTQCPDVCPTSMTTMAEVKRLLGAQGDRLQVLFITVDPERDTQALLKEYMANFDPSFIALRPEPERHDEHGRGAHQLRVRPPPILGTPYHHDLLDLIRRDPVGRKPSRGRRIGDGDLRGEQRPDHLGIGPDVRLGHLQVDRRLPAID